MFLQRILLYKCKEISLYKTFRFFVENLIVQIKFLVLDKHEFELRYESISKNFWNFQILRFLMQGTKTAIFSSNGMLKIERFRSRPRWREWKQFFGEVEELKIESFQNCGILFLHWQSIRILTQRKKHQIFNQMLF